MSCFKAVLFDWRGTLFYDESDADWLRHSAAAIGLHLEADELQRMLSSIERATHDPRVLAAQATADCSVELNRAAGRILLEDVAGLPPALAQAIWERDGDVAATRPYSDTPRVLSAVKERGARIAIVSDIHYDLRPRFAHFGLADCVDTFVLSFEHGMQKPDPEFFQCVLDALGVAAGEALMVGDRAARDAGGLALGITTLLLPRAEGPARGLDVVLAML